MWAVTHSYNTACIQEGLYYFSFSLWDLLSLKERQVSLLLLLCLPFFLCRAAESLCQVAVTVGIWLLVAILRALYRHLIQPRAGAPHKKTLLSHVSKIDTHMLGEASQVFSAIFQCKRLSTLEG